MKKIRFLTSLISIILLLSFALTACGTGSPTPPQADPPTPDGPTPGEGTGDPGMPDGILLVDEGKVNFDFVYSFDGLSASMRNHVFGRIADLQNIGVMANAIRDDFPASGREYEVLIGTFKGREEHEVSKYILGNKGYTIRVSGNKIVILGGTEESLKIAFDLFMNEYLRFENGKKSIVIDKALERTVREKYAITAMSIDGVELNAGGFKFVCDPTDAAAIRAAELMRIRLYDSAGYYLDIVDSYDGNAIRISTVEKSDGDGFAAFIEGGSLNINCQYPALFEAEMVRYLTDLVNESDSGDVEIGESYARYMHTVSYLDCGAVGDGVTDDFNAIKAAHDTANEFGLTIDACGERKGDGLVFNLGVHAETIKIMTDVDWTGASFIIDDSAIAPESSARTSNVFSIVSSLRVSDKLTGRLTGLDKSATNIGFRVGQKYLAIIYNENVRQYVRYGVNADTGSPQQEVILIHEDGSIDPSTPLLWNYDNITSITLHPASDEPITVKGGTFTTVANKAPRQYTYYSRGIGIARSNVTVTGLTHLITGEGNTGAPYNGFLAISGANNVLIDSVVLSGHKTYRLDSNVVNNMGTYDISAGNSNNITWRNCTQANSITDGSLWGIMGSNYCKNLTFDGCKLSRFDAHKGMYNSSIINSEIGHAGINAIGAGYLLIENTVIHRNNVVSLRTDYGSTWDGEIIIKNVTLKNTSTSVTLLSGGWYDHDFGYICHLPSVTVDNLTLAKSAKVTIYPSFSGKNIASTLTKNPVSIGGRVTIKNNANGYTFSVSTNSYINSATTLTEE